MVTAHHSYHFMSAGGCGAPAVRLLPTLHVRDVAGKKCSALAADFCQAPRVLDPDPAKKTLDVAASLTDADGKHPCCTGGKRTSFPNFRYGFLEDVV